ncbi:replication initiation regulator SeqA [Psychrosphaera sp. 1_MG-2023]|uniref:Negative modulator of initiation of replication n=1 Tax=Psychrosphaera algicola TaxID=3023714 RepID=A0ABT5FBC9_9GAMM|nr:MULTISPECIES: replication initiation regulator SeqA [unclassified Psychrosphaera]MDC2887886.1 replication initiation regulator SeqA [Psychrosphaera sp. G1-22]MDO6717987.1 replication initiation regulator SeqA [Psychrosphaera sp. 1_MG-2023]
MKTIQIEDDLYQYIASQTQDIGESASSILRRLLIDQQAEKAMTPNVLKPLTAEVQQNKVAMSSEPDSAPQSASAVIAKSVADNKDIISEDATEELKEDIQVNGNVFDVLNKEEVMTQKGAVGRFLFILAAFYRCHNKSFKKVLDIKGRERHYFGETAKELEASGSSIKPKQIPESHYWVVTNNNTPRKKLIITEVASALNYTQEQAEELRELI